MTSNSMWLSQTVTVRDESIMSPINKYSGSCKGMHDLHIKTVRLFGNFIAAVIIHFFVKQAVCHKDWLLFSRLFQKLCWQSRVYTRRSGDQKTLYPLSRYVGRCYSKKTFQPHKPLPSSSRSNKSTCASTWSPTVNRGGFTSLPLFLAIIKKTTTTTTIRCLNTFLGRGNKRGKYLYC